MSIVSPTHCIELDSALLPKAESSISNSTFDGVLKMHEAMFNTHDCVNRLPLFTTVPDDPPPHGQWFDNNRYCVCCDAEFDGFNHPLECPQCAAPWEREASES